MRFQELDWQETPIGEVSLRRRFDPVAKEEVHEVKLGDEFLMSSLFSVAEIELSRLSLAELDGTAFDVVVGGLGLGYTARAALEDPRVRSMLVVDALEPVIDWHERRLVPHADLLVDDERTTFVCADFFALAESGFDADRPDRLFDAILLDIDHSPRDVLADGNSTFYERDGLRRAHRQLRPGGVFGLWSNDPPDAEFTAALGDVFTRVRSHVVSFRNPLQGGESSNTVYVAVV